MTEPAPPRAPAPPVVAARASSVLAELHPAYFAMSMATGGVSIACHLLGIPVLADALLWVNVAAYALLWALTLARFVRHRRRFAEDWSDHQRGVGFFTTVAATCILGAELALLRGELEIGRHLFWFGLVLWSLVTYGIFTAFMVRETKPSLAEGINGGWLTAVVATQSLCVLGCLVSPTFTVHREQALFLMLALWLCGGMLYIWLISLIFYRYMFFRFLPSDLAPPYWINMGAMAISALAGTMLMRCAPSSRLLAPLAPFLGGFTLWYWATATWWFPMLVILGVWRYAVKRFPLAYHPLYWGAVFPLSVYTNATHQVAGEFDLPFVALVPRGFVFVALGAWAVTFGGMVRSFAPVRAVTSRAARSPRPTS